MAPPPTRPHGPVVGVDATPLLGPRTGIGEFVAGLVGAVQATGAVSLRAYGLTLRGWRDLPATLPPGVRSRPLPLPAGLALRAWVRAERPTIEWWTGAIDVVHGTNFVVPPSRRAARLVTVYDLTSLHHPEWCEPTARRYPDLVRRAIRAGAWVHTMSRSVAAECVADLGADPERIRVIAGGITPPPPPRRRPVGAPYVLALGTVEPRKDLPTLVAAFDAVAGDHPDLELRIAGPEGWGEEALAAAIAAARHRDRVRRLGWVADRDALLAGAAAVAYPSLYEGFGFPPLEAMAHGVPVVASTAGSLPEVLGDAALLVPPADVDALATALVTVLDDRTARHALVTAGNDRVTIYQWPAAGRAMADLYAELAGGGR
jgi:glycosyltransferase involved in cell wall biosynthesis